MSRVYRYPPEVHEFVKAHCREMRDDDLAEACNAALGTGFTRSSMRAFRGNHGYKNGLLRRLSREEYWKRQKRWPQGMLDFVREHSWGTPSKEMAEMVNARFGTNYSARQIKNFRQRHGIKSGVTGWFRKGRAPANKGRKREEYCSPEAIEKMQKTQFKPGHKTWDEKPVGTVTVDKDGYLLRKKQMEGTIWERWEFLHRVVWEEHNGPVPEGMIVTFKDGDRSHCDISNLMLVSRGELAVRNKFFGGHMTTPGIPTNEASFNLTKLKRAVSNRKKEGKKHA